MLVRGEAVSVDHDHNGIAYPTSSTGDEDRAFGQCVLLLIAGALWWTCHYTLLWNAQIADAYSNGNVYDLRFLGSIGGTVVALVAISLLTRRDRQLVIADHVISYCIYAVATVFSFALITAPVLTQGHAWAGMFGAFLSGMGNSAALLYYGELHMRIGLHRMPLAFSVEMVVGVLASLVLLQLDIIALVPIVTVAALASAALFAVFSRRSSGWAGVEKPEGESLPVAVDMRIGQLVALAVLTGFAYGLMRTFVMSTGVGGAFFAGFGSEALGSFLSALLLAAIYALQPRTALFEQCLLFSVPLVAAGMLFASLQGVSAVIAATINTCGFACFFALLWYFGPLLALRYGKGSTSHLTALLLLASQASQLIGGIVPETYSNATSSVLTYLILAVTLFMFWRDRSGGTETPAHERLHSSHASDSDGGHLNDRHDSFQPSNADIARTWEEQYGLSPRESEITILLLERTPYRQISERLGVSENTVKTHVRNIYHKVDVTSREELLAKIGRG